MGPLPLIPLPLPWAKFQHTPTPSSWLYLPGIHLTDGMEWSFSGHTYLLIPFRLLSTLVYGTNLIILYALVYDVGMWN